MWYIGTVLAFVAGYLYRDGRAEPVALAVAALAISFLGEHLSAVGKSLMYKIEAERARARMASLHVEAEEAKKAREAAEDMVEMLKGEVERLRGMLPVREEKKERVERIIREVEEL